MNYEEVREIAKTFYTSNGVVRSIYTIANDGKIDKIKIQLKDMEETDKKNEKEMVDYPDPDPYEDNPYESIKVIEAWNLDFNLGNAVKHISRLGKKDNDIQELKKAQWHLDRAIRNLEKK